MNSLMNGSEQKILHSWKEIASYLGLGVRTVQRYERQLGLPVRRLSTRSPASVVAFADELEAWLRQAPTLRQHRIPDGRVCPMCSGTGMVPAQNNDFRHRVRQIEGGERQGDNRNQQMQSS
jgi:hypothetical protein